MKNILACLFIVGLLLLSLTHQDGTAQSRLSEEQQIAQWKKWLIKYPPSKNSVEIESVNSFPQETKFDNDIYLWKSTHIETDAMGNIYVLDYGWNSIFKFDSNGVFIKKAGGRGQGPREFQNPIAFCITQKHLFVSDTVKYEISIWDLDLNFVKSFKVFKAYYDIAADGSGNIFGVPLRMNKDMELIDVLDDTGQKISSFGKPMYGTSDDWQFPNMIRIDVNERNEVYSAYILFPTVCRYDQKGNMIDVYEIDDRAMRYTANENIKSIENRSRLQTQIIRAIRANNEGFTIMHNAPFTHVLDFDVSGRLIEDYWVIRSYDYKPLDFYLRRMSGTAEILLLVGNPMNKIEVFRPKNR